MNSDVLEHSIGKILRPFPLSRKISPLGRKKSGLPSMQDCMVRPLSMAVLLLSTSAAQLVPASPTLHLQDWASFVFKKLFIYVFSFFFLAALGLRCCVQAVSSCSKRGLPLQRLPSCKAGLRARWPRGRCARPEQVWLTALVAAGTWQPPGPGLESVSAAVADAFLISHWGPQEAPGLPSQLRSLISKHLHTWPSPDAVTEMRTAPPWTV